MTGDRADLYGETTPARHIEDNGLASKAVRLTWACAFIHIFNLAFPTAISSDGSLTKSITSAAGISGLTHSHVLVSVLAPGDLLGPGLWPHIYKFALQWTGTFSWCRAQVTQSSIGRNQILSLYIYNGKRTKALPLAAHQQMLLCHSDQPTSFVNERLVVSRMMISWECVSRQGCCTRNLPECFLRILEPGSCPIGATSHRYCWHVVRPPGNDKVWPLLRPTPPKCC